MDTSYTHAGMRLSVSLVLWLVALSALVLSLQGAWQLSEEEDDLYAAVGRELTMVATAARSAVENAVRDGQESDIGRLLEQLELKDPSFDVFVFRGDTNLLGSSWGSDANLEQARTLAREAGATGIEVVHMPRGDISAVAPFGPASDTTGRIVIVRPTLGLQADLREERLAVVTSIAAIVVLLSVSIVTVVNLRLRRPISAMVDVLRRVAAGDLTQRMDRGASDELGELSREFDAMVSALERARAEVTEQTEAREQLEAEMLRANRLAIVGELAATLAHEVGSPLQVLGGRAEDIARRDDLPPEVARSASIIEAQVDRVRTIVERFLDVARRKAPAVEAFEAGRVVAEIVELLASRTRRAGVTLDVDVPEGITVRADPAQLQQVLLNLLQNALRASPRGSTVRLRAMPGRFAHAAGGKETASLRIEIEDEGPGIEPDLRERVFEPFFTAWPPSPRDPAGTGLGLSVVRTILHDHGGTITLASSETGGARFTLHVPRVEASR